ncbi:uncharacterized protein LOC124454093 isoform X1 [Xenia sp. Carnegie-2017]|uniref:uncharacterized protein LOC124454093 isoform X1 n=1 Tax=Xenia sp. Carnegie-2017 TaxID=2897299 RepID=UPI001F039150|nr:uncharacterized protein LOC124454093 isoform X1 [Xenia sp. Carnegie-2017]
MSLSVPAHEDEILKDNQSNTTTSTSSNSTIGDQNLDESVVDSEGDGAESSLRTNSPRKSNRQDIKPTETLTDPLTLLQQATENNLCKSEQCTDYVYLETNNENENHNSGKQDERREAIQTQQIKEKKRLLLFL